jgi:hypothetical protein
MSGPGLRGLGAARPDLRIRQAHDIMQRRLDHCLAGRGHHRFRPTPALTGRLFR